MGPTQSLLFAQRHQSTIAKAASTVTITPELEAARRLFASISPVTNNQLHDALVQSMGSASAVAAATASSSCTSSTPSSLLLQARHSYANFLLQDESLKFALPHSLFANSAPLCSIAAATQQSSSSSCSVAGSIKDFVFSILEKIRDTANQVSALLVSVATFVMKHPRLILAGSVGIASVAGVAYFLVIKQDVLRQYFSNRTTDNDEEEKTEEQKMFSDLEKQLIRQKIQAQSDLHQQSDFCPLENERRNAHLSLCCPITTELFVDPVFVTCTGHTYERSAITQWIVNAESNGEVAVCPITRVPIKLENLAPNLALKQAVLEHAEKNP